MPAVVPIRQPTLPAQHGRTRVGALAGEPGRGAAGQPANSGVPLLAHREFEWGHNHTAELWLDHVAARSAGARLLALADLIAEERNLLGLSCLPQQGNSPPISGVPEIGPFKRGSREHPTSVGGFAGEVADNLHPSPNAGVAPKRAEAAASPETARRRRSLFRAVLRASSPRGAAPAAAAWPIPTPADGRRSFLAFLIRHERPVLAVLAFPVAFLLTWLAGS